MEFEVDGHGAQFASRPRYPSFHSAKTAATVEHHVAPSAPNPIIHKTEAVQRWLADKPKFELLFQPVYHLWVNQIERLWKAMHDTVTRNHQCASLIDLCQNVARFLDVVQPFPDNKHGVVKLKSAF